MTRLVWPLVAIIVVLVSIIIMPDELIMIAEAIYSIPPTPAWSSITIIEDPVNVTTTANNMNATFHNDNRYYGSDGSINISIIPYTP